MDDILIASPTEEDSDRNTVVVLNFLAERGYKVSREKAQASKETAKYLGLIILQGQCSLFQGKKVAIYQWALRTPGNKYEGFGKQQVSAASGSLILDP